MEEPCGFGGFYYELEGAVGEGCEPDLHGYVSSDVGGLFVELFAEFDHVYSEGAQGLTHLGVGLGDSCQDSEVYGCCCLLGRGTSVGHLIFVRKIGEWICL